MGVNVFTDGQGDAKFIFMADYKWFKKYLKANLNFTAWQTFLFSTVPMANPDNQIPTNKITNLLNIFHSCFSKN